MDRGVPRTVTCFRWRVRINSLSSWWYCLCALAFEGYLLYRAVSLCCSYNELPWRPGVDRPVAELYAYITLIVINVMCLPFFVVFSLFQIGNYANDEVRLGRDSTRAERICIELTPTGEEVIVPDRSGVGILSSWRHVGPLSQGIHVLASFCLLLPRVLVQAQEIKYGFLQPEAIWWSELDGLFGRHDDRPHGDGPAPTANSSASVSVDSTSSVDHFSRDASISVQLHPEYLNYCFALFFHALRYAAIFWDTAALFSLLFSFHLLLSAAYFALSFCGFSVLYKLLVNPEVLVPDEPEVQNFMLTSVILLALSVAANFVTFLSPLIIFNYGYTHYRRAWKRFLKRGVPMTVRFHDDDDAVRIATCCRGYTQHILATVFLLTMVGLRLPVVFDYVTVYRASGSVVLLASLLADVIVMLGWICLWFLFTVRQRWNFKVILSKQFVWEATCNGRSGQAVNLDCRNRVDEHRTSQKNDYRTDRMIDHRNDRMIDHRTDRMIDQSTDQLIDQRTEQRTDNRRDHDNEARIDHRSSLKTHRMAASRSDNRSDRRSDRRYDKKTDRTSDRKSAYSSPSLICGCASSKTRSIHVEENTDPGEHTVGCPMHLTTSVPENLPTTKRRKRPWRETIQAEKRYSTSAEGKQGRNAPSATEPILRNEAGNIQCHVADLATTLPVDLRHDPDDPCVRGGADAQENFATETPSALTPTLENTLVRGYRWNVRDKCSQYFREAACHKGQSEKPFRKRPPAPPPSPAPVPHPCCDRVIQDSGIGSSPLNEKQTAVDCQCPSGHSGTLPRSELLCTDVGAMSTSQPGLGQLTDPHRPVVISQSTVQLLSNHSPCAFDHQVLSKSADALDGDRTGVTISRELAGSGSAEVIRIGAKTGALFFPKTIVVDGRCVVESTPYPRIGSGNQVGGTFVDRPRSCHYPGSLSPSYPFIYQSSLSQSSLHPPSQPQSSPPNSSLPQSTIFYTSRPQPSIPMPSIPQPSLQKPSPHKPSIPHPYLPQPSLQKQSFHKPSLPVSSQSQQQGEHSGASGDLPPSTDTSSSDSTNSQVLCSQV